MILGPDDADRRVRARREDRRPGADVPERHLHRRGEPDRHAGAVDPVRLRPRRAAGRPAAQGNYFAEARLLGVAHRYQQATDWHLRVPKETPL